VTGTVVAGFEIDGNLCVNTDGDSDWSSTPGQPVQRDGFLDNTGFTSGAAETNWPWSQGQLGGSVNNGSNQQDIGDVYATTENSNDQVYTFFGFTRRAAGSGSFAIRVELNQKPNMVPVGNTTFTPSTSPVPDRTAGDLLLTFVQSGTSSIQLSQAATWSTTPGAACDSDIGSSTPPCWVDLPSLAGFTGATNSTGPVTNPFPDPTLYPNSATGTVGNATLPTSTFSEVAVNLSTLFGTAADPNNCSGNYGVLNVRSASSPTGSLTDWVAPTDLSVPSTCASVLVNKTWDIDGTTVPNGQQPAGFNATLSLDPAPQLTATDGTNPSFGVGYPTQSTGIPYQAGQDVTVGETTTLPPGCLLTGQEGGGVGTQHLLPGINTFQITNVVTCTRLTLEKVVNGGSAVPADWMLSATAAGATSPTIGPDPSGDPAITDAMVPAGTYTLAESTTLTNYELQSLTCSDSTGATVPVTGNTVTIPQGANVTCTFTNAAQHSLTLSKTWLGDVHDGDVVNLSAQVGSGTPVTITSTSPNSATTAALPTLAGDAVTLTETFTNGFPANYTTTLACNGVSVTPLTATTTPGNGGHTATFTVPTTLEAGAPITCTFTNSGMSTLLTLQKVWVNGAVNDTANLEIATEAVTKTSTSTSEGIAGDFTDESHDTSAPLFSGESVTVTDTPGADNTGTYTPTLACEEADGAAVTVDFSVDPTTGAGTGTFTAPAADVTCTFTNTRTSATLDLDKTWIGAVAGDSTTLSVVGTSPPTSPVPTGTSTVTDTTTQTDTVLSNVTIFSGDTITFNEEFGADNQGAYTSTSSCPGFASFRAAIGGEGGTFTVPSIPPGTTGTTFTCTITNTRSTTGVLVLQKSWHNGAVAFNGTPADTALLSATVGGITTTPVTATVPDGGNGISDDKVVDTPVTQGPPPITLTETLPATNRGLYTSTLTCVQNGTTTNVTTTSTGTPTTGITVSGTYTVLPPPVAGDQSNPVCTFLNMRGEAEVTLQKTWVNGANGDTAVLDIAGSDPSTSNADTSMNTSTATGIAGDFTDPADATAPIFGGETVTVTELLGGGNAGSYDSQVECVSGSTIVLPTTSGIEGEFTVPAAATPADITCTFTNTRTSTTLNLQKVWVNGATGDSASLSIVGPAPSAAGDGNGPQVSATETSTAPDAPSAANTATATVFSGQALQLSETLTTTSATTTYQSALACTGAGVTLNVMGTSSGLTVPLFTTNTPPNADINCTFTNTRIQSQLVVMKDWHNGFNGDSATMTASGTGLTATQTANSTAAGTLGDQLDTASGHFIMTPILSGGTVTLTETLPATGSGPNTGTYTLTLTCENTSTTPPMPVPITSGSFTAPTTSVNIVCTFTNTRTSTPLTLTKAWNSGIPRDSVELTITQGTGDAERTNTGTSTVPGTNGETIPASLDIFSGEPVTVQESFIDGEAANYISTLSCSNGFTATGTTGTFNAPANPTNDQTTGITCTFTNSRAQLQLMKSANVTSVTEAGDVITYSFTLMNTGGTTLTDIAVTDTRCLPGTSTTPCTNGAATTVTGCPTTLAPGASAPCTGTTMYTVTPADVNAGAILDTATATATATQDNATKPINSNPWSVSVDVRPPQSGFTSIVVNTNNTLTLAAG